MNSPILRSDQIIREEESHWKVTVLLMACVLVLGLAMRVDWTVRGKWLQRWITERIIHAANGAVAVPYPTEAYAYVRARDWKNALEAAQSSIRSQPTWAEGYHIAGLAAGQIYGLHSNESRAYYAKYVELEPDQRKTAFVKQIFPDLMLETSHPIPQRQPAMGPKFRGYNIWLVAAYYFLVRFFARRKRAADSKAKVPKGA